MRQGSMAKCDRCGASVSVVQETPYEFRVKCECGEDWLISHFHGADPPVFARETDQQQELSFER